MLPEADAQALNKSVHRLSDSVSCNGRSFGRWRGSLGGSAVGKMVRPGEYQILAIARLIVVVKLIELSL